MKIIFLGFLLSIVGALSAIAQQFPISPNAYDANGKRTGHWTVLYDSTWHETKNQDSAFHFRLVRFDADKPVGKVRDFFRNGVKQWDGYLLSVNPDVQDGEVNYYYENGRVKNNYMAVKGKQNGFYKEYYSNGNLFAEGLMKNDSATGKWITYSKEGVKLTEVEWKLNEVNGIVHTFYPNGKVQKKGYKIKNQAEGWWEEYYESGQLKSHEYFKDGKYDGPAETYYENGQIETKGNYKNDLKEGEWVYYFENGQVSKTGSYDSAGNSTGIWKYFYSTGTRNFIAERKDGKLNGAYEDFYESGKLKSKGVCVDDTWQGQYELYYENGKLKKVGTYQLDSMHGDWVQYYDDGTIENTGHYTENKKNGEFKYYRTDGTLELIENLKMGVLNGPAVNYYSDGAIKERRIFLDGVIEGKHESFYANGAKFCVGSRIHGNRVGDWYWYFANGKLDTREAYADGKMEGFFEHYYVTGQKMSEGSSKNNVEEGWKKNFFADGRVKSQGAMHLNERHGHWVIYDSVTNKKQAEGDYVLGKKNGKWNYYLAKTKYESYSYYLNGFEELQNNIEDSVKFLADRGYVERATQALSWLNKVRKRDYGNDEQKKNESLYWHAYVKASDGKHEEAIKLYRQYLANIKKWRGDTIIAYANGVNNIAVELGNMKRYDEALQEQHSIDRFESIWNEKGALTHYNNICWLLTKTGRFKEEEAYIKSKLEKMRRSGKHNPEIYMELQLNLADLYFNSLNNFEAGKDICMQVMRQADSLNLHDSWVNGMARYRMSESHRGIGERSLALHWSKSADPILLKVVQSAPGTYLDNLQIMGELYNSIGYPDSAAVPFTKMLTMVDEWNIQNKFYKIVALDGLGETYFQTYNNTKAKEIWMEVKTLLEESNSTTGGFYMDVLQELSIVLPYLDKKDIPLAEQYLLQSVDLASKYSAGWKYRNLLGSLAAFYTDYEYFEKAAAVIQKRIALLKEANETNTENYADAVRAQGNNLFFQDDYKGALAIYQMVMPLAEQLVKINPKLYIETLYDQGACYSRLNQMDTAEVLTRQSLEAAEKYLGETHIVTIEKTEGLAGTLKNDQQFTEAEKYFRLATERIKKSMGATNLKYAYSMGNIAGVYKSRGDYKKALEYYHIYENLLLKHVSPISNSYVTLLENLAFIHANMGNFSLAEKTYLRSLALTLQMYGRKELAYAWRLKTIGQFYYDEARYDLSEKMLEEAKQLASNYLGNENSDYANFISSLAKTKIQLEKYKEAEEMILKAVSIHQRNIENRFASYLSAVEQLQSFYNLFVNKTLLLLALCYISFKASFQEIYSFLYIFIFGSNKGHHWTMLKSIFST
ncbi:MAG: tetratricopeptide repeat protein [Bacteroidetes bacterium]|nr:tetratricopeptide repeat protein [Bacteroidota bacterium]